jgi:hypothetical protein
VDAVGVVAELIDVANADALGNFEMRSDAEYISALLPLPIPAIAFRIFNNGIAITETKAVTWTIDRQFTQLTIPLAAASSASPALSPLPSTIRGMVNRGDGAPAAGVIVRAFDRNLGPTDRRSALRNTREPQPKSGGVIDRRRAIGRSRAGALKVARYT